MPSTEGGVLRLWNPVKSPKRLVVRSVDAVTRLQVPRVGDEPFSERAWSAKGHSLTLRGRMVRLDCEIPLRKRRCLRSSCRERLRSGYARDHSCCSSRCNRQDYGR